MVKFRSMQERRFILVATTFALFHGLGSTACAQPKMKSSAPRSYIVGDQVNGTTTIFTKDLEARTLSEIVQPEAEVVVLILFGAAAVTAPDYHPLRGGIWCPDSFDDLPLQRALIRHFEKSAVQFVPVAAPPAYSSVYGFTEDIFTSRADNDPEFISQVKTFIELTEKTRTTDVLPFDEVYYDPKFRLAYDPKRKMGKDYGPIFDWQGKFRWHGDPRKYTTPSIWLLDGDLKLLREPFVGNNYNDDPPQILYGFRDVMESIEALLRKAQ